MPLNVLSFVAGIIVVQQFFELPSLYGLIVFLIIGGVLAFYRYWRLMLFVTGVIWAVFFATFRLLDRLPDELESQYIEVEGQVIGMPRYDKRKVRFDFAVSKPENDFPKKIRLSWYFPKKKIKTGQVWALTVKLKKPHGRFNASGFDYEKWLFIQNIGATGYVRNMPEPFKIRENTVGSYFDTFRQLISDKLDKLLEASTNKGLIKALTIGVRHDLSQQQWTVFRQTGTVHLLAISGLHIGLVSGLMYLMVLNMSIRCAAVSPQKNAAGSAILIAFFYSALAGFSLPTQRSMLMLVIAMATIVWQRKITPVNTLSLTLFAVLIVDPLVVLSIGFWLSFLAVMVIIYSLAGRLGHIGYWKSAIKVHWVTAVGLAPLLLFSFQQVSIISPLANFISVPIISFLVVPLCLLSVIIMFVFPLMAEYLLFFVDTILAELEGILLVMANLPYASVNRAASQLYVVLFALLGVFILIAPKGFPARWLSIVFLFPLLFVEHNKPKQGEVIATLLDVGQGLSIVVETARHVLVFDTGAKYSDQYDMGEAVVIPFLESKDIDDVDMLLISHSDNDHIGGAESIFKQKKIAHVLTSVPDKFKQYSPLRCSSNQSWVWDQVEFEVLSPNLGVLEGENNNSCVLKVSSAHGNLLLTGDIEKQAENWLVENVAEQLKSEVLIAPHHGSKTSSTDSFLRHVSPNIILIPSGYQNRFGFPHDEVLKRYKNIRSTWVNTANEGALIVKMNNNLTSVESSRKSLGKYWNK